MVLTLNGSGRPVEFGAIAIHLEQFPEAAREAILENWSPLGTILADYRIEHFSNPQAFMRVPSDPLVKGALDLAGPHELYGRRNVLLAPGERVLAEVVEILPPVDTAAE